MKVSPNHTLTLMIASLATIALVLASPDKKALASIPPLSTNGSWESIEKTSNGSKKLETFVWRETTPSPTQTLHGTTLDLELTYYNPVPPPSEILRAYETQFRRVSYAISTQIHPSANLLEYTNPLEKTQGAIQILQTPRGILTIQTKTLLPTPPHWPQVLTTLQNAEAP